MSENNTITYVHHDSLSRSLVQMAGVLVPAAVGLWALYKLRQFFRSSTQDEAQRAPNRVSRALERIGKTEEDFNDYERGLLSEVIFPDEVSVKFSSIGGLDAIKLALFEAVINPMKESAKHSSKLLAPPKGLLLYGPPGNGKTMLAKALAGECQGTFINMTPAQIHFKYVGESPRFAQAFFSLARKLAPCIIFIDEADCLFASSQDDHSTDRLVRSTILSEWDGLMSDAVDSRVVVLCATNNPCKMDKAIHRRLARQFEIGCPNEQERALVLKVHLSGEDCPEDVVLEVAARTEKYSSSDLLELCKAAATIRARDADPRPFSLHDFELAMEIVSYAGASADKQTAQLLDAPTQLKFMWDN